MKNLKYLLFGFLAMATFTACDSDDDTSPQVLNIVETAVATEDLSILVDALNQAGLVATLEGNGPFTVFAPTNAAFETLLNANPQWNSLSDIDNATLTNVLKFHVIAGEVRASDLSDAYVTTVAEGPNSEPIVLQVNTTGGVVFNGSTRPVTTNIETSNGVVHIVDEVMLPPTVVNLAVNNPVFSTLVAALTRSDLTTDYVSILSGDGPFTVFAPTNSAFQALLDSNDNWNSLDDIPVATLEAVLNYHVVNGANVQAEQLSDDQQVTALGGTFTVRLDEGAQLETTSGQMVNIMVTDVQGANGVVHVVDEVLLP